MTSTVHLISHTQVTCSTVTSGPCGRPLSILSLWAGSPNQGLHLISNWTMRTFCEETRVKNSPLSHTCNMFYFVCQRVCTHVCVYVCALCMDIRGHPLLPPHEFWGWNSNRILGLTGKLLYPLSHGRLSRKELNSPIDIVTKLQRRKATQRLQVPPILTLRTPWNAYLLGRGKGRGRRERKNMSERMKERIRTSWILRSSNPMHP